MNFLIDNRQNQYFPMKYAEIIEQAIFETLQFENCDTDCEVSVSIVDNSEIKKLNKQFRNIDRPTDVLSFPQDDKNVLGDIVISLEKAVEQADEFGHSIERELGFLTAHSMLHLLGYDHMTHEDEVEMFSRQEEIMRLMKLSRG